jgi:hypothetical protein
MPLFLIFIIFNNHSHSTIIHSFILHHSPRPVFLYPHRFFAQQEKNLHEVPSRELNSGLPYSKPTRYNWATPHLNWATPHRNWATPRRWRLSRPNSGTETPSSVRESSVVDPEPEPDWTRTQLGFWIRIHNPDPDLGGQNLPTNIEKS